MKETLTFIYELVKFIFFSIPIAIFLYVTLIIIRKFKNI